MTFRSPFAAVTFPLKPNMPVALFKVTEPAVRLEAGAVITVPLPPLNVVSKLNCLVLPAEEELMTTEPVLLRNTLPAVLADRFVAVVNMGTPEVPMSPVPVPVGPSFKLTVVPTS